MHLKMRMTAVLISILGLITVWLSAPAMAVEVSDINITIAIEDQLLKDPGVNPNALDVKTSFGIVTLSGTVDNILAKDRAVKVTQTVRGVRSVVDTIIVDPLPRSDAKIKDEIRQTMLYDPLGDSWNVDVFVNNGQVRLTGEVESWAERKIIENHAKGVKGVVSMENDLIINYQTARDDQEMEEEIERRLYWDALVDESLVNVEVQDHQAILTGSVGSAAEKAQAERDSWVAGITAVDSSELEVDWFATLDIQRKQEYVTLDDSKIARAIKDAFLYDPRVNTFKIEVMVDNGRVTLQGTVDNLQAKRSAAKDARNTIGVWNVKNLLKVRPQKTEDATIAANIRTGLLADPNIERFAIDVTVIKGEVYLSGNVDSHYEKAKADHIAAGVKGVSEVNNRIMVQQDSEILTHSPFVDPWYTYDYDWYIYPDYLPTRSDADILAEIENEFFWSPFVDGDSVTVEVDDGLATLSGSVGSWFAYNAAVENALEGGAVAVNNELNIQ